MSGGLEVLKLKEEDLRKFLITGVHLGSKHKNANMKQYIFSKRQCDGYHIINLRCTWEKLLLAARAIASMKNPGDIVAVAIHPSGTRAVIKFQLHTGCHAIAGHFVPGTFTNHGQKHFLEPQLLIVSDPVFDRQAIMEASKCNLPVIAFCNTDASLRWIDIAIPCNTRGYQSIGLMWWMLTREILAMRGSVTRDILWNVAVDLFINRTPEEEKAELEKQKMLAKGERTELDEDGRGRPQFSATADTAENLGIVNTGTETWTTAAEWNTGAEQQLTWPTEPQQVEWGAKPREVEWGTEPPQAEWGAEPQQTEWGTKEQTNWRDGAPRVEWGAEPQQDWGSKPPESAWDTNAQSEDLGKTKSFVPPVVTNDWN